MKKIQLSIITLLGCSSLAMAGGDLTTLTTYEMEDTKEAEMIEVTPIVPDIPVSTVVVPTTPKLIAPIPKKIPVVVKENSTSSLSGFYGGLGLVAVKYDPNCICKSGVDKTAGFMGKLGYDFNKYFGLETRGLFTTLKDDGGTVKHLGAFLKPMFPLGKNINSYGLLGFAKSTTQGSLRRTDTSGLALGLGLEYDLLDSNFGFFTDYERLLLKSDSPDLDALTLGVNYKF
jgi:hypothetical protein